MKYELRRHYGVCMHAQSGKLGGNRQHCHALRSFPPLYNRIQNAVYNCICAIVKLCDLKISNIQMYHTEVIRYNPRPHFAKVVQERHLETLVSKWACKSIIKIYA